MSMQPHRMQITDDGHYVTITYRDAWTDEMVTRRFSAPLGRPGYVREHHADGTTGQPCGALQALGDTLRASTETLPDVIRREYRRMRRAERRQISR